MTKDQEARILDNQALIMKALAHLVRIPSTMGGGVAIGYALKERIRVIEEFKS